MKKLLFTLMFVLTLSLAACDTEDPVDYEALLNEALDEVSVVQETTEDITLPNTALQYDLVWESSDESHISTEGEVNRPQYDDGDQVVTLTASISDHDMVVSRDFEVTVLAYSYEHELGQQIEAALADIDMPETTDQEDLDMPLESQGFAIVWESSNPDLLTASGEVLRKPSADEGDQVVVLTATISENGVSDAADFEITVIAYTHEEEAMMAALETLSDPDLLPQMIYDDVHLPNELNGVTVSWHSSNPDYLNETGEVQLPYYHRGSQYVRLTATLTIGDLEDEVVVHADVGTISREASAAVFFDEAIEKFEFFGGVVEDDLDLSDLSMVYITDQVRAAYTSLNRNYLTDSGHINPPIYSEGVVEVEMRVNLSYEGYSENFVFAFYIEPLEEKQVTNVRQIPFENLATEYEVLDTDVDVFYMQDGSVPYVDIESFIWLLEGALEPSRLDFIYVDNVLTIENRYEAEDEEEEDTVYYLEIDFDNNTVYVNTFSFFTSFVASTETDFGESLSSRVEHYDEGEGVLIPLGDYRFELVRDDENYLMPLHLANLFFSGSMFDVHYNYDSIHGVDTYQIMASDSPVLPSLRASSRNGEDMPRQLQLAAFNYMALSFDYFYGLQGVQDVNTYYDVLSLRDYVQQGNTHYERISDYVLSLDDLHTSFLTTGYFAPNYRPSIGMEDFRSRTARFYNAAWSDDLCNVDGVQYYDDDRIALVPLEGFTPDSVDEFAAMLAAIEARGTVEDVIVDLSCNTGGNIGSMIRIIAHMTDEEIPMHQFNAGDGSTVTYMYDSTVEAYHFDWHVMTSAMSYSAANQMAATVKEMGIATLIGERTSGGASSITTNLLPNGAILIMSSNNVLSDQTYNSLEMGVSPEYSLSRSSFFDDEALTNLIQTIKDDQQNLENGD